MNTIESRLNTVRDELLDLSLRNTLLNYRHLKSRGVEAVDELPEQIFRVLVTESKKLSFLPIIEKGPDTADQLDEFGQPLDDSSGSPILLEEEELLGVVPARHADNQLQTPYTSANLQKRLLNSFYTARTYIEEQGVNVLYMAFGMLQWRETPDSELVRLAPLILVPVEIDRTNVQEKFRVQYTGDDIGDNLSLRAKLKADFRIDLPELWEGEEVDVQAYFGRVEEAVRPQKLWAVDRSAVVLGFFSFSTFLMYNDLDIAIWPQNASPAAHPLMESIVLHGFQEPPPVVDEAALIDDYVSPQNSYQILDADSTQTLAILDVKQGRNLVIQGPPGTGKSQTISNLIAEALGQNKSVLFVAEKMAALEVVKRRLDAAGLGDACLELHSHKTNKRVVLAELQRTLDLGRPKTRDYAADFQTLIENRDQLNDYSAAVNTPVGISGLTPYRIYGRLMRLQRELRGVATPPLDGSVMLPWTESDANQWFSRIEEMQALIGRMGVPKQHPFWGSRRTRAYLPADRRAVQELCRTAAAAVDALNKAANALADRLNLPHPETREAAETLVKLAQLLLTAPPLAGIQVRAEEWQTRSKDILAALNAARRVDELHQQYDPWLLPEAWQQDVRGIRQAYMVHGPKWYRLLSGEFRRARNSLTGLSRSGLPGGVDEQRAAVEAIMEMQRLQPPLQQYGPFLQWLFGRHYRGPGSDWESLTRTADWLIALYKEITDEAVLLKLLAFLNSSPDFEGLGRLAAAVESELAAHEQAVAVVVGQLELFERIRFGETQTLLGQPLGEQRRLFQMWFAQVDQLQDMVVFNDLALKMDQGGLTPISGVAAGWPQAGRFLAALVRRSWLEALLAVAMRERPILAAFNTEMQQRRIQRFCTADKLSFQINRTQLAEKHWQQLPRQMAGGQLGVLLREFEKKRRHLPIRKLMAEAGHAIQAIKPVFMMSPLSIPMYLPPGAMHFDLVVFDEASQVRPVEAFGAILRGNQCVVVGDSKQLPPTDFFNQMSEVEEEVDSPTADLESVLGLFSAQGAPQRMLRWHYRSRHESLITVSNYEFYENRLVVFPSPDADKSEAGVVFHYLPDTAYDRGRSSTNEEEARIVAEAVMKHARTRPHLTLGVAAFSIRQRQVIQDQVELLRRQNPELESFFNTHAVEPFFVKNLENVQGDERDVIFISVGYGKTAEGYLSMNFGPLNKDGGERRLNVLITRARLRCEIFTNLTADDIDLSRTNARGVIALKRYLKYAETGNLDVPVSSNEEPESLFEEAVLRALQGQGYEVDTQVGSAGFRIDLAVKDKKKPGHYLLGIECDGAAYHSARSARDRDRLRQSVLENMGWHIHRIWSTDWFRNPEQELQRVVGAIEAAEAKEAAEEEARGGKPISVVGTTIDRHEDRPPAPLLQAQPYQVAILLIPGQKDLHEFSRSMFVDWVQQVVEVEGPVHIDEVRRRIVDAAETRMGSRIKAAIDEAVAQAVQTRIIHQRGDFLWGREMKYRVRSHAGVAEFNRRMEQIAPEEVQMAIRRVVENALGIYRDDIPSAVCSFLGFGRTSEEMRRHIDGLVEQMIATKQLKWRGDYLIGG